MESREQNQFYLPALDGLRFVAFLLVFIHNAPADTANPVWNMLHEYGWIGVDLFFCLSGFLITRLLVNEHQQTGDINVQYFYLRRAIRIFPIYYFYVLIALLIITSHQTWSNTLLAHIFHLITFTYNLSFSLLTSTPIIVFIHLWTLSYETQFYIIIPLLLKKLLPTIRNSKFIALGCVFLLGTVIRFILILFQVKYPTIHILPITHFEALLGGVAIGLGLFDKSHSSIKIPGYTLLFAGLLSNSIIFLLPNPSEVGWFLMLTYPLVGIGMSLILLFLLRQKKCILMSFLSYKPIVYLGKISYGLYIYHIVSINLSFSLYNSVNIVKPVMTSYPMAISYTGLAITIIFSIVSYKIIEQPFLRYKNRFTYIKSRPI